MKRFSDLNIKVQDDRKIYECPQVSITEILNCEIQIIEFLPEMKTRHGEGRYLVRFNNNEKDGKFFTNSKIIKSTLEAVPKEEFPFLTVIKCLKVGQNSIYKFT